MLLCYFFIVRFTHNNFLLQCLILSILEHTLLFPLLVVTEKLLKEGKISNQMYKAFTSLVVSQEDKPRDLGSIEVDDSSSLKWLSENVSSR